MNFLAAGIPVALLEIEPGGARQGRRDDPRELRGVGEQGQAHARPGRRRAWRCSTPTLRYDDLRDADLVIEAVFEDMDDQASRSSRRSTRSRSPARSSRPTRRRSTWTGSPRRRAGRRTSLGMHFFSPANVMKLLEVVRGAQTATDVLMTVMQLAKRIGKTAVVSGVCDGFIGNRMIEQYLRQAMFLVEEGASPAAGRRRAREVRHGDGSVPHERPRRQRRRLADPQAPLRREAAGRAIRGSPTGCAKRAASARRPAPAGIATRRAGATRCPIRPSTRSIAAYRDEIGVDAAQDRRRTRSSTAASSRWSTRARASSRRASRSARPTSTSSISPATAFRAYRGGPMLYADMLGLYNVDPPDARVRGDAGRRCRVLDAGAAARAARRRGQDVQRPERTPQMTDAVIVSTARTGLAKSWRGAFNMTHGATLGGHVVAHAIARAKLAPGGGRRRADRAARCRKARPAANIARQIALRAGCPVTVPGVTVNRFCSSGLQTIALAAQRIMAGEADVHRRRRRRVDLLRAERAEQAHDARRVARPRTSPRSTGRCSRPRRRSPSATAFRASARTSTACRASSARRLQPPPAGSTTRSCR